jgi:glycosyltransferase involved in cell wall biosynthesis
MMRLYAAIRQHESHRIRLTVRVIDKTVKDDMVIGGKARRTLLQRWRYFLITRYKKLFPPPEFSSPNKTYRSQCLHHSGLGRELNTGPWDMAVLHWLGDKTMSIEEIGGLRIPYLWHLHDMWLFSGVDHTSTDRRYAKNYSKRSRLAGESGPDINRKTFRRKMRSWRSPRPLITPSNWLAQEAELSPLTKGWPVLSIPNPVDTAFWEPIEATEARRKLGIASDATVFLFGAYAGANAFHKGPDIFFSALRLLSKSYGKFPEIRSAHILLFGKNGGVPNGLPFPVTHMGPIGDESLKQAYGAASAVVVPSRVDNFPSIATEAHACGRPVIATRVGGLTDIVSDQKTGRLVNPEDPSGLAEAMFWVVESAERNRRLGKEARERAEELWTPQHVAGQYVEILLDQLRRSSKSAHGQAPESC